MIEFGSVVPERENLPFYMISMPWYTRWQRYTGCMKVQDISDSDDEDAVLGRSRKGAGRADQTKSKDRSKVLLGDHPGVINGDKDLKRII